MMGNSISLTLYADVCYRKAEMLFFGFFPQVLGMFQWSDCSHFVVPDLQGNEMIACSCCFLFVGDDCR